MPSGRVAKVVHLSLQSPASADCSPALRGYGFVQPDGGEVEPLYFEPKAIEGYQFDDLQVGQPVEFDKDPKLPIAKSVKVVGEILAPPPPQLDLP